MLALATLKSKCSADTLFKASSTLIASFGDLINALGSVAGSPLALNMTVQVKQMPQGIEQEYAFCPFQKKAKVSPAELDWPICPSDCVHFLIKSLWPDIDNLKRPPVATRAELEEWDSDASWDEDEAVTQWWVNLAEPIRATLVDIYQTMNGALLDVESTTELPLEILRNIAFAGAPFFRFELERRLWEEMETDVLDALSEIFLKMSSTFLSAIQTKYSDVYGDTSNEMRAKLLLEIFLEVPLDPRFTTAPLLMFKVASALRVAVL